MFDDTSPFDATSGEHAVSLQRTKGRARCTFKSRDGKTVLADLGQSGSFKVKLPKVAAGTPPEAVLLNTAGGLTGGDVMSFEGAVADHADAVFTTQASERAYRALAGEARVTTRLDIGAGGRIAWLPQETILFDGARLHRAFDVDLAAGATLLAHESIVFGRTAMGETVRHGLFSDFWRIRRDGRLVHADAVCVGGDIAGTLARAASLGAANAMATVLYLGDDAEARAADVREITEGVTPADGIAGVSAWDGRLVLRAVGTGGAALRRIVMPALKALQDGRPLPRVWSI